MQVSLNTRISPEISKRLDEYATKTGKSKASIVEEALKKYLTEQSSKGGNPKMTAIELLSQAIKNRELEYYRQAGSFAYVAKYEDGELKIVYNAASAKEARPGVDFELVAQAKWTEGQGFPHWNVEDLISGEYERIDTDYTGNVIEDEQD